MAFGTSLGAPEDEGHHPLTVLAASADVAGLGTGDRASLRAALVALVDEAMTGLDGVQATLARWREPVHGVDRTSYEGAARIGGYATLRARWATRWLRAAGNDAIWLGPALLARLGEQGRAAAEGVACPRAVGPALCLELPAPDRVAALEAALSALLPSFEDYLAALREG
jgi:hypothetical protein